VVAAHLFLARWWRVAAGFVPVLYRLMLVIIRGESSTAVPWHVLVLIILRHSNRDVKSVTTHWPGPVTGTVCLLWRGPRGIPPPSAEPDARLSCDQLPACLEIRALSPAGDSDELHARWWGRRRPSSSGWVSGFPWTRHHLYACPRPVEDGHLRRSTRQW
jgi:hypothetical protein